MTTKNVKKSVQKEEGQKDVVDIVFDFSKLELFELLDMVEMSANQAKKEGVHAPIPDASETVKFIQNIRKAFVSSSRPLTGNDFNEFMLAFWTKFNLNQTNPN